MVAFYGPVVDFTNFLAAMTKVTGTRREGAKLVRTYDEPQTPYQRLLATGALDADPKRRLAKHFEALNPAWLQRRIDELQRELEEFATYVNAA